MGVKIQRERIKDWSPFQNWTKIQGFIIAVYENSGRKWKINKKRKETGTVDHGIKTKPRKLADFWTQNELGEDRSWEGCVNVRKNTAA